MEYIKRLIYTIAQMFPLLLASRSSVLYCIHYCVSFLLRCFFLLWFCPSCSSFIPLSLIVCIVFVVVILECFNVSIVCFHYLLASFIFFLFHSLMYFFTMLICFSYLVQKYLVIKIALLIRVSDCFGNLFENTYQKVLTRLSRA